MSNVSCGIIGLPNAGKSTLFNALTGNNILAANYPFATIEPNVGIVPVPDERLQVLKELFNSENVVPATVTFVDIAGLVSGASQGEGLGNQFLSHIRNVDLLIHVVRAFKDKDVIHVNSEHEPAKDIEIINTELVLADLQTVEKRLSRFEKEARANPKLLPQLEAYKKALEHLNNNQPLWSVDDLDKDLITDLHLITCKKVLYVFNIDDSDINNSEFKNNLENIIKPSPCLFVSAKIESELSSLDALDAQELLSSYGQSESSLISLTKLAYKYLGLQSFLTAGEKEVRAWTISQNTSAKKAAGVIHKDFEKGFIAADIASFDDLVKSGNWNNAKTAGKVRTEGKDYMMKSDDVVIFKFNV